MINPLFSFYILAITFLLLPYTFSDISLAAISSGLIEKGVCSPAL